jgi:hypothetical protein
MNVQTLSPRTLNRTLLGRQHLLERTSSDPIAVMRDMGGIQMQYAPAGYIGLWSRVRDFARPMLTGALEERRAVQGTMMRATIHTVAADDYWPMMAGIRRFNREWYAKAQAAAIGATDMEAVADAIREELAGGPLRIGHLSERLAERGFPPRAATWAATWVDMVRVPPSGTWERRRADLYGLADRWLPAVDVSEEDGMAHLVRRYLGAFGPAPLKDVATWMGVTVGQVKPVAEGMALSTHADESGRTLFDLPDATLSDPETPAPARFIGVWDAMLLVHARRTQVLPEEYRPLIFNTKTPHSVNTFLLDGQVAGTWRHEEGDIQLSPLRPLTPTERAELEEEAHRLEAFHGD